MKHLLLLLLLCCAWQKADAQYVYGTTGLLHMPTAEMQRDKTFLFGTSYLDVAATPNHWGYDTFNYYINVTFFPWLEVGYTCTLHKIGLPDYGYSYKFRNQDRSFHGRLRLWKEGWRKAWTPQVVLGANDPSTNDILGNPDKDEYGITGVGETGNGHWNRWYLAVTKHVDFKHVGELGVHAAYVYNKRKDYHLNGPAVGADFRFCLPGDALYIKALNKLDLMAEYDSRTVNVGASYSIWKDHINLIAELTECRHFSGGIFFKVHLK